MTTPVVLQASDIEDVKENLQPKKSGLTAAGAKRALAPSGGAAGGDEGGAAGVRDAEK